MKGDDPMAAEYLRVWDDFCCEYSMRRKGWCMNKMHYHRSYELFIMTSGETELMNEDHIISMKKGDVALFRKNVLHKNNGGSAHGRYAVNFSDNFLAENFMPGVIPELLRCFDREKISISKEYFEYAAALLKRMREPGGEYAYLAALLTALGDIAERSGNAGTGAVKRGNVDPILEYINKYYGTIENIDEIADFVHMSKSYLCQKFKRETSMTVSEYLNSVRIKNACAMLADGFSVSDTALRCGYSTSSYFCKMFKSIVSMTPSEYRRYDEDMRNI